MMTNTTTTANIAHHRTMPKMARRLVPRPLRASIEDGGCVGMTWLVPIEQAWRCETMFRDLKFS
jgi:hypothetical protein